MTVNRLLEKLKEIESMGGGELPVCGHSGRFDTVEVVPEESGVPTHVWVE